MGTWKRRPQLPEHRLPVWRCGLHGDHRQTPGGLKKSKESKAFRKKLTKRPLALRCQTQYTQAHDLGGIAMRYLDCPEGSFCWKIRQLLEDNSTAIDPAVVQTWHDLIGEAPPCFSREIHRAAFAILWMGLRGEREGLPSMLATSFAEAAGVAGRQKWCLVLSSSARVSQVTYQTVVGVRYPELVTGISWNFGKFVTHERPRRGGFLPVFWDIPRADTHAAAERVLPAPNTPLIANPVRPSHRANTIALKVARTCPSSSWRSGKRAICNALCSSFSQQTVSIPIANLRSLSAAVKSLRRCRGPLGCKLSVHWIPQHNLSLSRGMRKKTSSSWALLVSPIW